MTKYLISFPSGAMVFPDEDLQAVSDASHVRRWHRRERAAGPGRRGRHGHRGKIAVACRCAQEVRAFQYDPAS